MSVTAFNRQRREQKEAESKSAQESAEKIELTAEQIDLAARCKALNLDLPENLNIDQVREFVENAEQEQAKQEGEGKA